MKKFCTAKELQSYNKNAPVWDDWGRKYFHNILDKVQIFKIYKALTKLKTIKKSQSQSKNREDEKTLSQRRHTDGQQTYKNIHYS